jgi:hypothetical protein
MVSPIALLRQPSALDLAEALIHPGGAREYIFPDPRRLAEEAADREELALARVAYDAAEARLKSIAEMRNEIISEGDTGGLVDAWLIDARAHARRDETADDDALHRAAEMEAARRCSKQARNPQNENIASLNSSSQDDCELVSNNLSKPSSTVQRWPPFAKGSLSGSWTGFAALLAYGDHYRALAGGATIPGDRPVRPEKPCLPRLAAGRFDAQRYAPSPCGNVRGPTMGRSRPRM